jgi:hypothetical protein
VVFFTTAKLFQANALMPQQCPVEHWPTLLSYWITIQITAC